MSVFELEPQEGIDPDEPIEVTIRRGDRVHRIECHTVVMIGTSHGADRVWQSVVGDGELLPRIVASAIHLFTQVGELSTALAVNLVRDLPATMESIGSGLSQHATWRAQHGEAERSDRDDARGEGRDGPRGP